MRIFLALVALFVTSSSFAAEQGNELDRRIIGLLLGEAEVVVKAHKDTSGLMGMDPRMKQRYGLAGQPTGVWLFLKDTLVGPKVEGDKIMFWCTRGSNNEPFFLAEGDYLLFLKHDAQQRWVLVADYLGIQPFAKGLDELVKEVKGK
jgi:hypothetical protein